MPSLPICTKQLHQGNQSRENFDLKNLRPTTQLFLHTNCKSLVPIIIQSHLWTKALQVTSKFKYHKWKQNWKSMRRNSTTYYDGYWHIHSPQWHVWDMQHLQLVNMLAETPLDPPIPIAYTGAATHHHTQPQSRQHCLCQCKILQRLVLARFVSFLPYQVPTQFN
jgi:hypothetical protein